MRVARKGPAPRGLGTKLGPGFELPGYAGFGRLLLRGSERLAQGPDVLARVSQGEREDILVASLVRGVGTGELVPFGLEPDDLPLEVADPATQPVHLLDEP